MPTFCLKKIRPHVRVRSPTIQLKENVDSLNKIDDGKTENSGSFCEEEGVAKAEESVKIIRRKVMIVADSTVEAKNAIQWALTHTVQSHDIVVLLYVKKTNTSIKGNECIEEKATKVPGFLCSMKNTCLVKRPEVQVDIAVVEGKEKGTTIVEEAKKQEVALLVLGQKKQSMTWRLLMMWAGKPPAAGGGMVDYCIQNATCMAVAVRRKSKKVGGYLISTKRQKDFWLLA